MTITVTSIDQGPFTATGLAQTVAYTFMTLTDEEISVYYDAGAGRVLIDPAAHVVTRNKNMDGSAKEGGTVELAVGAAPAGSSIYLRADPRADRDLVWSDTGSRLKNLNEEQDRITLRQLIFYDVTSRAVVVDPGQTVPSPQDVIDAANAVAGRATTTGSNISASDFRSALGFGDIFSVLDYVPANQRAAILDGTTTADATAWVEAAWNDLPNAGVLDFGVNTTWRFTQDVVIGGKSALIQASGATFIIAHSGVGVSVVQTGVDQYLEWEQPRYVADLSTGSVQACWAVSFPSVVGYGATNFKSRFGSALASAASGSSPWPNTFQRYGEVTGAWYSEIDGEVRGPAPASESVGPRLDSAFLRIDRCYEMQILPTATSYYVGRVVDQVSYCEGIRIAGTHVGCGQALYVNPSMTAGAGGYNGLALYLDGHIAAYSVGIDAWKWNGVRSATTLDLYRWGDSGTDWTGFALRSAQGALIPCNIECGPPLTGTRRGVHVTATDGFGADCVVLSAKIANADTDVEFGASTVRNSVIAPTPYAGEGANRFVDSGTGNVILRDPSAIASCTVSQLPTLGASSNGATRLCTDGYGGIPGVVFWNGSGWIRADNGQAPATTGAGYVRTLKGSAAADFPSIPNGGSNVSAGSPLGITVTGARAGDGVSIGTNVDTQGMSVSGYVFGDDTVRIVLTNNTGAAIDPGAIVFTAYVVKS